MPKASAQRLQVKSDMTDEDDMMRNTEQAIIGDPHDQCIRTPNTICEYSIVYPGRRTSNRTTRGGKISQHPRRKARYRVTIKHKFAKRVPIEMLSKKQLRITAGARNCSHSHLVTKIGGDARQRRLERQRVVVEVVERYSGLGTGHPLRHDNRGFLRVVSCLCR